MTVWTVSSLVVMWFSPHNSSTPHNTSKHYKSDVDYYHILLMGDGFMGGLAPHFFVFDFFTNFHFDFSKDL